MNDYDINFIRNLLKYQIEIRVKWVDPNSYPYEAAAQLFWDSICENGIMHINKVDFPDIRYYDAEGWYAWPVVYADSMMIHHLYNDEYSEKNCKMLENIGLDGPYCFENVIVNKGDVVIDAGGYMGDWSAVAAKMGGKVYSFEPSPAVRHILYKCSELNNFRVVEKGLGDLVCEKRISTGNAEPIADKITDDVGIHCQLTTIDKFSEENNIHIDFIKADIEGYESNMLIGAARTLKEDCPKLAIRTYHKSEDSVLLPKIVKDINPNYNIINRKSIFYAYVD